MIARATECDTCGCDVPAGELCHCARGESCPDEIEEETENDEN